MLFNYNASLGAELLGCDTKLLGCAAEGLVASAVLPLWRAATLAHGECNVSASNVRALPTERKLLMCRIHHLGGEPTTCGLFYWRHFHCICLAAIGIGSARVLRVLVGLGLYTDDKLRKERKHCL